MPKITPTAVLEFLKENPDFWRQNRNRCAGCDRLLAKDRVKWMLRSRYGHGELCGACRYRDAHYDFIGIRRSKPAGDNVNPYDEKG